MDCCSGTFDHYGTLVKGQKVQIVSEQCDENGMMDIEYLEPVNPGIMYYYKAPTNVSVGAQPLVQDDIAEDYVQLQKVDDIKVTFK